MANIVNVYRPSRSKRGDEQLSNQTLTQTSRQQWHVEFDSNDWTVPQALAAAGLPQMGDADTENPECVVTGRGVTEHDKTPLVAVVDVAFSVPTPGKNEKPDYTNHTWNVTVTGSGVANERPMHYGWDAATEDYWPIVTPANEMIQPFLNETYYVERITVDWDTDAPNWAQYEACRGKVNDAEITINIGRPKAWNASYAYKADQRVTAVSGGVRRLWKALLPSTGMNPPEEPGYWAEVTDWPGKRVFAVGTLKCEDISWKATIDALGNSATHVTAGLLYNKDGWSVRPVLQGYQEVGPDGKPRRIKDGFSSTDPNGPAWHAAWPKSTPSYLDADGKQLPYGAPAVLGNAIDIPAAPEIAALLGSI